MTNRSIEKSATSSPFAKIQFYLAIVFLMAMALYPAHDLLPETFLISDKLNHFAAFFVLSWLIQKAYGGKGLLWKVVYLLGYGIFIEAAQYFVPYRETSLFDFLADCAGIIAYFGMTAFARWIIGIARK